ncbi:MAG: hypothetical protein IJY70_05015, partial [Clostridia bacterium]|nr:hypothetical protein [Clostridia bacterium]
MSINERRESAIRKKEGKKVLAKREKEEKKALALQAKEEKRRKRLGLVVVNTVKFQSDIDREYEERLAQRNATAKKDKATKKNNGSDFVMATREETAPVVEETAITEEEVVEETVAEETTEEVVEEVAEEPVAEEVAEEVTEEETTEEVVEETAVTEEEVVEE